MKNSTTMQDGRPIRQVKVLSFLKHSLITATKQQRAIYWLLIYRVHQVYSRIHRSTVSMLTDLDQET